MKVKQSQVIIALLFLLIGGIIGYSIKSLAKPKIVSSEVACRSLCSFIPNSEFAFIGENGHCYCKQKATLTDQNTLRAIEVERIVDWGVVTEVNQIQYIPLQSQQPQQQQSQTNQTQQQ